MPRCRLYLRVRVRGRREHCSIQWLSRWIGLPAVAIAGLRADVTRNCSGLPRGCHGRRRWFSELTRRRNGPPRRCRRPPRRSGLLPRRCRMPGTEVSPVSREWSLTISEMVESISRMAGNHFENGSQAFRKWFSGISEMVQNHFENGSQTFRKWSRTISKWLSGISEMVEDHFENGLRHFGNGRGPFLEWFRTICRGSMSL
jgi:hypothetical protein